MGDVLAPVLFGVALWWSTTAVAIHVNGLPRHTFGWSMAATTLLLVGSLGLMYWLRDVTTPASAYAAFAAGLVYWAWQDVSFYLGIVTGWRKQRCPDGCSGWAHFRHALEVSAFHEIAILVAAGVIFGLLLGAPNEIALWTFVILWWMHQSAKLNVFLGVSNLNVEFLPEHLRYLEGFFRKRPMNLLFPVSITVSTVATALLIMKAAASPAGSFDAIGYTLLATLMALAVLEHWFLVVPLPAEKLWQWAITGQSTSSKCRVDVVVGVLGAGKTTYLKRLIDTARPAAGTRTVVVTNDFGQFGIDASLLARADTNVVELANGCICCTLRGDLVTELKAIVARWQPDRLLVEPSGVADAGLVIAAMSAPGVLPSESNIHIHAVFDASRFVADYSRLGRQLEVQARLAGTLVVNKADLVSPVEIEVVAETLRALAPGARIVSATRGLVIGEPPLAQAAIGSIAHLRPEHRQSWSAALASPCKVEALRELLSSVASGGYGNVERLKGIARISGGWVHFDVAAGRPSIAAFAPGEREQGRVMAIGTNVDTQRLAAAFNACGASAAP